MPAVGSSNMKIVGSSAISSATSSLRWSPCESAAAALSRPVRERDALQHRVGARDQVGAPRPRAQHVVVHARGRLDREPHVLGDAEARKQVGQLERAADARRGVRAGAGARVMSRPSSSTSPALAASWPEIRLK